MATDYISREAAIKEFCDDCMDREWCKSNGESCSRIKNINAVSAANVVEVVRCKDCHYYYKDEDGYEMCDNSEGYDHISADGFCAWAKRRADNG